MKNYKSTISELRLKKVKTDYKKVKIGSSQDVNDYVRQFYHDDLGIYESMFILLLNNSMNTIGYAKISQGGVAGTVVDIRIVCKYAVDTLASAVVLVHNHPSGSLKPSDADMRVTKKVMEALKVFDIGLADHLIITEDSYYSFADGGLIG